MGHDEGLPAARQQRIAHIDEAAPAPMPQMKVTAQHDDDAIAGEDLLTRPPRIVTVAGHALDGQLIRREQPLSRERHVRR